MGNGSNSLGRRNFIKRGIAGVATLTVAPTILQGSLIINEQKNSKIVSRKLGNTGLELPVVSMGVMNADNPNLLKAAFDKGIVHFDTAHGYQRGRNEEMVGKVLKNMDRDSFIVSTKIPGNKFDKKSGEWKKKTDAEDFVEKFETSLERLQMDYVDILYFHARNNREEALEPDLLEAMIKLKEQGKTRFIGVSTHRNEPEVIQAAIDSKVYDIVLTAYNFRQDHYEKVGKAIENASKAGLGVIAMKTQAGVYWDKKEKENKINMKAALKWTLQNPHVHTTIPGFDTFDQLNDNIEIMDDLPLSPQEIKDLKLGEEMGMLGMYCNQCGICDEQCNKVADIPTLMRSYMYAFGYNNLLEAKDTLNSTGLESLACDDCNECIVNCKVGFNVKDKLQQIYEVRNIPDTFLV